MVENPRREVTDRMNSLRTKQTALDHRRLSTVGFVFYSLRHPQFGTSRTRVFLNLYIRWAKWFFGENIPSRVTPERIFYDTVFE